MCTNKICNYTNYVPFKLCITYASVGMCKVNNYYKFKPDNYIKVEFVCVATLVPYPWEYQPNSLLIGWYTP